MASPMPRFCGKRFSGGSHSMADGVHTAPVTMATTGRDIFATSENIYVNKQASKNRTIAL